MNVMGTTKTKTPRNVVKLGMIQSHQTGTKIMRDKRNRRPKDARHSFKNEEW